ncbi:hypothetical protein EVB81_183 [Rhizobium phage RHph_I46]|uniref:Uncharacterized protein n=1 Tax=Rhizobium phage RHph_I1_9 TaxID=2509729 RepID=A0A7S5RJH5_9CAUD|nr:hypothetical protein PP936_gp182 [Rhizobium phage RHph_I1_9]QIG69752.1 hypothetical protein EVB81_183 [Rhizobium phage RHph_I46]QIG71033.1 hypothetical protein EVB92_183 [Rhizobium phage RHph_I9]QIG73619.1 hypothetical protein EVC04_182 [Rhizobium phage RHph_I1_9]QIG76372.1 hypothetical protein EVC25_183 [Rhizobium phage RHph_I34]
MREFIEQMRFFMSFIKEDYVHAVLSEALETMERGDFPCRPIRGPVKKETKK